MKKLIAIILVAVMLLALCACNGSKAQVCVLWSGAEDHAVVPGSLINAMDRAMYIESISYDHHAAGNDQATQTQQASECLEGGCAALVVELVDTAAAQEIVNLAKAKNVPVVFFGCEVDAAVVAGYDKCAAVSTDLTDLDSSFFEMVSGYVLSNTELTKEGKEPADDDLDLDNDGKISYVTVGELMLKENLAVEKDKDGEPKLDKDGNYKKAVELVQLSVTDFDQLVVKEEVEKSGLFGTETTYRHLQTPDGKAVELLLVADDIGAMNVLLTLQEMGLNTNQLATCFVSVFTVGSDADYKAYVMESMPTEQEARKAYLEEMALVADMTALEQKEWDKRAKGEKNQVDDMVFNTLNQIDAGRLSGAVIEDQDAIAEATAKLVSQLLKGKAVAEPVVEVPYIIYEG